MARSDDSLNGRGDDMVVYTGDDGGVATIIHDGQSNLAIWAYYANIRGLLVNDIGTYSGQQLFDDVGAATDQRRHRRLERPLPPVRLDQDRRGSPQESEPSPNLRNGPLAAEKHAIETEKPKYNLMHNKAVRTAHAAAMTPTTAIRVDDVVAIATTMGDCLLAVALFDDRGVVSGDEVVGVETPRWWVPAGRWSSG